jgi:cytochrome c-type biogenesis protein CcmH
MRELIREKLRNGESPQEIRQYFLSKYGEWILLQPEAHGINLAVYVLPILGLLLGGAALFLAARRWTRSPMSVEAEEPSVPSGSDRS